MSHVASQLGPVEGTMVKKRLISKIQYLMKRDAQAHIPQLRKLSLTSHSDNILINIC